jgi:hypothetical protein
MKIRLYTVTYAGFLLMINHSCSPSKKSTPDVSSTPANKTQNKEDAVNKTVMENDMTKEETGNNFFADLFQKNPGVFDQINEHRNEWNVQIIYTRINRDKNNNPSLKTFHFNKENARYFYPASTVKLPAALLALQKLKELQIKGLDRNTTMLTQAGYGAQTGVYNDPTTPDGKPTIAQYIRKIFLVSDNDAFNRLYEFLGQDYFNNELIKKGFKDAQILHRLSISLSEEENRHTNPVNFYDSTNRLIYAQPMQNNIKQFSLRNDKIGNAYYSNGTIVNKPMDFSKKNRLSLDDLHTMLTGVVFPQTQKPMQRFNISEDDRRFVLKYMSMLPGESVFPAYDTSYNDAYVKFILFGSEPGILPKNIRIFNKVGDAYGQMIDAAYVVDYEKKIEFIVSASIYCNKDEILNDDKYDYNSIGFPFMKNIGKALYNYELKRQRNYSPDLSGVTFTYDK